MKTLESSFVRLEEILEKMNSGEIGLDDSLKLYEEADKLILECHKQLTASEQKVETLIKNRQNQLQTDENNEPIKQPFS